MRKIWNNAAITTSGKSALVTSFKMCGRMCGNIARPVTVSSALAVTAVSAACGNLAEIIP